MSLLVMSALLNYAQADLLEPKKTVEVKNEKTNTNNSFNLANIVDNFLNNKSRVIEIFDNTKLREEFVSTTSKFNQGNATSAYEEYSQLIDEVDEDILLLNLSKVLYKIGFFTLANKAEEKIVYKNQYYTNMNDLEVSYKPAIIPAKEDEIFFAKIYSSIFFDNSALEANHELLSKKDKYHKSDYYNYLLSQSYYEQKDYHRALNSINKAISINSENVNYKLAKIDILSAQQKYSDALKIIKKLEKNHKIIDLADDIQIKKQTLISQSTKNEKEKKYSSIYKTYLEGNYEKVKKDCLSILSFNKKNDKITALYAKAELALGDTERANTYFTDAYKINKRNPNTLEGLGDIRYIHKDYKGSIKMYKRALRKNKKNPEILIKLMQAQKDYSKNPKAVLRTKAKIEKLPKNHLDYYNCAISSAQKDALLKEEYLKKSLSFNPMHALTLGELVSFGLKNKNFKNAKGLINSVSFTLEKNYYYYYLLGLYNEAENKKSDAIKFYRNSLDLNPNFEIANIKLLKLTSNKKEEI